jgi:hypothetical protein
MDENRITFLVRLPIEFLEMYGSDGCTNEPGCSKQGLEHYK